MSKRRPVLFRHDGASVWLQRASRRANVLELHVIDGADEHHVYWFIPQSYAPPDAPKGMVWIAKQQADGVFHEISE